MRSDKEEARGTSEEPIWEMPIRDTVSRLNAFPVFSLHFGVTCRCNVKHIGVASFVSLAGYGSTATKM